MKIILFICSANKDHSKTAEDYFSEHYKEFTFDSAGTNEKTCNQLGTTYLSEAQLAQADRVYVMETKHLTAIKEKYGSRYFNKIEVLHIKDLYPYGSKELVELLKVKIRF